MVLYYFPIIILTNFVHFAGRTYKPRNHLSDWFDWLQEEGWPLGLQPLNVRVGLVRNRHLSGSISFNTLLTGSPTSSTVSSSDLDTEVSNKIFPDKVVKNLLWYNIVHRIGISKVKEVRYDYYDTIRINLLLLFLSVCPTKILVTCKKMSRHFLFLSLSDSYHLY